MNKHNDTETSLKAPHGASGKPKISKTSLLLSFIRFIAWVIVIGLLLSPLACTIQISEDIKYQQGGDYE